MPICPSQSLARRATPSIGAPESFEHFSYGLGFSLWKRFRHRLLDVRTGEPAFAEPLGDPGRSPVLTTSCRMCESLCKGEIVDVTSATQFSEGRGNIGHRIACPFHFGGELSFAMRASGQPDQGEFQRRTVGDCTLALF